MTDGHWREFSARPAMNWPLVMGHWQLCSARTFGRLPEMKRAGSVRALPARAIDPDKRKRDSLNR